MFFFYPYHLLHLSPWPLLISLSILGLTQGVILFLNKFYLGLLIFQLSFMLFLIILFAWFKDIIRESTYLGYHTILVKNGLRIGMYLFLISEILIFIGFFWGFFHSSLAPTIEIGCEWPPLGITTFSAFSIPGLNTIILLSSGFSCTWSHHALISKNRLMSLKSLLKTIYLGVIFTCLQGYEYLESSFTISDSIYGSVFYSLTGLHGLHVIIGTILLFFSFIRLLKYELTNMHHWGYEAALLYWHMVDGVWLFLYLFLYYWGS